MTGELDFLEAASYSSSFTFFSSAISATGDGVGFQGSSGLSIKSKRVFYAEPKALLVSGELVLSALGWFLIELFDRLCLPVSDLRYERSNLSGEA